MNNDHIDLMVVLNSIVDKYRENGRKVYFCRENYDPRICTHYISISNNVFIVLDGKSYNLEKVTFYRRDLHDFDIMSDNGINKLANGRIDWDYEEKREFDCKIYLTMDIDTLIDHIYQYAAILMAK